MKGLLNDFLVSKLYVDKFPVNYTNQEKSNIRQTHCSASAQTTYSWHDNTNLHLSHVTSGNMNWLVHQSSSASKMKSSELCTIRMSSEMCFIRAVLHQSGSPSKQKLPELCSIIPVLQQSGIPSAHSQLNCAPSELCSIRVVVHQSKSYLSCSPSEQGSPTARLWLLQHQHAHCPVEESQRKCLPFNVMTSLVGPSFDKYLAMMYFHLALKIPGRNIKECQSLFLFLMSRTTC